MAQQVDVPGFGVVEFPDDMNDDDIAAAIKRNMAPTPAPAPLATPAPSGPLTASGAYNALDEGLQSGVAGLAALPRTIGTGIQSGLNWLAEKAGRPDLVNTEMGPVDLPTYESARAAIARDFGGNATPYKPQNLPEEYIKTFGEFVPNVALGGAPGLVRGALASETAGQLTKDTMYEPYARAAGALAGGLSGARRAEARAASALPQEKEIAEGADKLYRTVEAEATKIPVPKMDTRGLVNDTKQELKAAGVRRVSSEAYSKLDDLPDKVDDLYDIVKATQTLRRELFKAGDGRAANIVTQKFEQAIDNALQNTGSPIGVGVLKAADREHSINKTLETLGKKFEKIEDQTASTASGKNLGNKYRQGLTGLKHSDDVRGLKPDELAQIDRVIEGNRLENSLRAWGNRFGGGGGIGQGLMGGGAAGLGYMLGLDPASSAGLGLGVAGSGAMARAMSNRMTERQAQQLRRMVQSRSGLNAGGPYRPPPPAGLLGGINLIPTGILGNR